MLITPYEFKELLFQLKTDLKTMKDRNHRHRLVIFESLVKKLEQLDINQSVKLTQDK